MEQNINEVNLFDKMKAHYATPSPRTIREKVAVWAFDDASTAETVIARLEQIDCAGCFSPAPIYYTDMAREIGELWPEIDNAMDDYREVTGEAWTPKANQNFLTYLWFAYEWTAHQLAEEIRGDLEA